MTLEDAGPVLPSQSNMGLIQRLQEYLSQPGTPNERLYPGWLAKKLDVNERDLLTVLAYGVRSGIVELHWETYCPFCGLMPEEFRSLKEVHGRIQCLPCETEFDVHLDRDVRVTFSAAQRIRRTRNGEIIPMPVDANQVPTRGLDLLLVPAFWELFSGDAPGSDESLRIQRVALLFTDLKGSTAMYAERGDPRAYHLVRDHFVILGECIERNGGSLVKTIGDAVMASFASSTDAVQAAFEAQDDLAAHSGNMGGELILKAGVHAGACLVVTLNDRLDFFGSAVNTAARVQGLSCGNDVMVSDEVLTEMTSEQLEGRAFHVVKSFDASLRGLAELVRVHRLVATRTGNKVA